MQDQARSRRTVVLPQSLAELLAEYAAQRPRTRSNIFFLTLAGTPYTPDGFESSWGHVRARRDAKEMDDPFAEEAGDELAAARFHDLRHTHATELLRAGVHIKIVAERLGDSEATVMKTSRTCSLTCRATHRLDLDQVPVIVCRDLSPAKRAWSRAVVSSRQRPLPHE